MIVSNSRSFAQKLLFVIAIALLQNAESKTPKLRKQNFDYDYVNIFFSIICFILLVDFEFLKLVDFTFFKLFS